MRLLYIGSDTADYQNDVLLHGLKNIKNLTVIDTPQKSCMYKDIEDNTPLYGRGFTIFKTLNLDNQDRSDIKAKIYDKFFDIIIYGSAKRNLSYIHDALPVYKKSQIVFIDGEDDNSINFNLLKYGLYFKRELDSYVDGVYPISFGFPQEKIHSSFMNKTKDISDIIPNSNQRYSFDKESDYYKEYQSSKFAWTWKKAGWDCMRHYEILFNRCLPVFFEIDKIPNQTMVNFPKTQIQKYQERFLSKTGGVYSDSMRLNDFIDENEYNDTLEAIFSYSKENLTTLHCAESVLSKL